MFTQRLFVMKWTTFALCLFINGLFTQQLSPPIGEDQSCYRGSKPTIPYLCTEYGCSEINVDVMRFFEEIRNKEDYLKIKQFLEEYLDYSYSDEDVFNNGGYKGMEKRIPSPYASIRNPPCDYCNGIEEKFRLNSGHLYFPDNVTTVKCQSQRKCGNDNYVCVPIKKKVTLLTPKHPRSDFHMELRRLKDLQLESPTDYFLPLHRLYNFVNVEVTVRCVCLCAHPYCE